MLCGRNDYGAGVSAARKAVPAASSFSGALLLLKENGISLRQDSYKPVNRRKRAEYTAWPQSE